MQSAVVFFTLVSDPVEALSVFRFVRSLRAFGGPLAGCPVWVIARSPDAVEPISFADVSIFPLEADLPAYPFAAKTAACAQAEALCCDRQNHPTVDSLAWFNPECLVVQPPLAFHLAPSHSAAFRPVHLRNVGVPAGQALDPFWRRVYGQVHLAEAGFTVESFVDGQVIYPYFNTHIFAVRPAEGLLAAWQEAFASLVSDGSFQNTACADGMHQIFLHQAVLSALVCRLPAARLRLLPYQYSYPLHLHPQIPAERQAKLLNELVCPVYEEEFRYPHTLNGLAATEPLAGWLAKG